MSYGQKKCIKGARFVELKLKALKLQDGSLIELNEGQPTYGDFLNGFLSVLVLLY